MLKQAKKPRMFCCMWCGREGTRGFRSWDNKTECASHTACANRVRKEWNKKR